VEQFSNCHGEAHCPAYLLYPYQDWWLFVVIQVPVRLETKGTWGVHPAPAYYFGKAGQHGIEHCG